ncbi:unnamed protein product [Clonostachys byssicola]|uniref:Kelch repeat protein n=1 Tax=Clonostachys byssicola TaxID=160290 RepID=A0A9N9UL25_9HYPO|nr:unnamed protein product [Clonostachys byssicola]
MGSDWNGLTERDDAVIGVRSRRLYNSIAVLGDYLYIEGGVASSWNSTTGTCNSDPTPVNKTLSIPLNRSWSNSTITYNEIDHNNAIPAADSSALWADETTGTLYRWAGGDSRGTAATADWNRPLWKFTADGKGGGSWEESKPANKDVFDTLKRASNGATASCAGMGFYIGGSSYSLTDYYPEFSTGVPNNPIPGMLTYNMTSKEWRNETYVPPASPYGALNYGKALCVEGFGPNPLVMVLGGSSTSLTSTRSYTQNPMNNISFYDPVNRQWHSQELSGTNPVPRDVPCLAGAKGKNGTYEIFMYGGSNDDDGRNIGDVWVLSLPGFQWFQQTTTLQRRRRHACAVAGKSQMIAVGGGLSAKMYDQEDPWPNAINVFDMNTLQWKDKYDADAPDYDSPEVIKNWYNRGGLKTVNWSSNEVKALFATQSNSTSTNTTNASDSSDAASNSGTNVGAIVGGVIGGLALIAILAGLFWFLRRRKAQAQDEEDKPQQTYEGTYDKPQQAQGVIHEMPAPYRSELDDGTSTWAPSTIVGSDVTGSSFNKPHPTKYNPSELNGV